MYRFRYIVFDILNCWLFCLNLPVYTFASIRVALPENVTVPEAEGTKQVSPRRRGHAMPFAVIVHSPSTQVKAEKERSVTTVERQSIVS